MSKTSTYPSVESFSTAEKTEFLGNAMCIASGSKTSGGDKITANIPFTTFQSAVTAETTYDASSTAPISGMGVADALASFGGFEVATLDPTTNLPDVTDPSSKTIYLTANGGSATANVYDEWIYSNSAWEQIGVTTVDLSDYYTKTEVDNMIPSVPVTDVTVDGTSVLNQGVAEITMPSPRTYALFNGGAVAWESGDTAKFDLTSTTEFNTGLNTDSIAVNNTKDGFVVPAAGIYNVTISIYTNSIQQSSSIYTLCYGLKKINSGSADTDLEWDFFTLDNVNPALQSRHIHAIVALQANDVVAPFIKNTDPNVTSWTASISLNYVSFEKLGPVPQNN